MRLNQFIASTGAASRREADEMMAAGRITVNGQTVVEPGHRLDPEQDAVKLDGRRLWPKPLVYVVLNKPEGIVTTTDDPQHRPTVVDMLNGVKAPVFPVGRLDVRTSGVLLLTNDGELALRLTHPRYGCTRVYWAKVNGWPAEAALRKLAQGVYLPTPGGRLERTLPARARIVKRFEKHALLEITVQEGRTHLVRLLCAAIGHPVRKLERVRFAFLTAAGLPLGRWRYLQRDEIQRLKSLAAAGAAGSGPAAHQPGPRRSNHHVGN